MTIFNEGATVLGPGLSTSSFLITKLRILKFSLHKDKLVQNVKLSTFLMRICLAGARDRESWISVATNILKGEISYDSKYDMKCQQ